ncbi:unnamed protein product [Urochloa decumbens]|uniref:NB-ARC domain-containing protein n=1 Tax=Urochloa decumbens TaxID=240449 RepID=A0ABC8XGK4_9POAL
MASRHVASMGSDPRAAASTGVIRRASKKQPSMDDALTGVFLVILLNNDTNNPWCDSSTTKTGSSIIKSDVVGEKIEEDTKKIVDLLIRKVGLSSNSVVVNVAITGMGGIGKTTLARMVFADSTVEDNFEERIWLSVNQDYNEISVLQSVLASFGAKHEGFAGNKDLLERALKDTVRQRKKFLLVMDDVWSEKVWNGLLRVPLSHAASGCCVLITTRNDGVAHGMKAQYLHRVDKLQTEDAWILLKNQVVVNESDHAYVDGLKGIGMEIVERCDCLPLAIKVIGGLLRYKTRSRDTWMNYIMKDEGILLSEGQDTNRALSSIPKLRHLSISNKAVGLDTLQKQASLRTLMLFGTTTVEPIMKCLLNKLSCLRVLYLDNVNLVELPDSICHLKHLRYLCLSGTSISTIPEGIGELKFLEVIDLFGCTNISQIPSSILKLRKLRALNIRETAIASVPPGFRELKDLVTMLGFPTHSDGSADGWCSLEELGSLSKLRGLDIGGLEKAPSGSTAGRAMLSSKHHLTDLELAFTSRLRDDGEVEDNISEEEHKRIEDVLSNLCPPTSMEELDIVGYFARGLPQWIRNMSAFESLRRLALEDYACCMQLPSGLGQLPFLDYFWVTRAPSVQFIGHDFLHPSMGGEADGKGEAPVLIGSQNNRRHHYRNSCGAGVAFPKLRELGFEGMLRWTKWEWEQQVKAMPVLESLFIEHCKLHHLPAGLAQHAYRLRELDLRNMEHLVSVENFPSLVKLWSYNNPRLERISKNPSLQCIDISNCTALEELDGLTSLQSLVWEDLDAEALPQYLRETKLKKLRVDCSRSLLKLIALQDESAEWGKIKHVQQLKAYAGHKIQEQEEESDQSSQEDEEAEWYIYYTKEPYSFEAYLGEFTGNFTFHVLSGFIILNL